MRIERLEPKDLVDSQKQLQYAQAVRAGDLLFCSGQIGWDVNMQVAPDYGAECKQVFENIKTVLAEAGCDFKDVIDVTSLHTTGGDIGAFWSIRNEYFAEPWPAWTMINDVSLASPRVHVEVKVTAAIPS
jgi:enamine deaminase RidA (YjgF/YER057c/UK114 family)